MDIWGAIRIPRSNTLNIVDIHTMVSFGLLG